MSQALALKQFRIKCGLILKRARVRSKLSIPQAASLVQGLDTKQLSLIEAGEQSIQCRVFYQLLTKHYRITSDEENFFCTFSLGRGRKNEI